MRTRPRPPRLGTRCARLYKTGGHAILGRAQLLRSGVLRAGLPAAPEGAPSSFLEQVDVLALLYAIDDPEFPVTTDATGAELTLQGMSTESLSRDGPASRSMSTL